MEEKKIEAEPESRHAFDARQVERSIKETKFTYGELLPDHPVQRYVESVAQRIPRFSDFPLTLVVAPDMRDKNASAYPDGTIIISRGLLEFADKEDELLGVIAHEYTHVYREHTKKQHQKVEPIVDSLETGRLLKYQAAEAVSLLRLHEYEADLRGTLELLDKNGINPIAYKLFLEKLAGRERGGGITHGFSMDRALNIGTVTYMYDLESVEAQSRPLRKDIIAMFDQDVEHKRSLRPAAIRPMNFAFNEDELKQRQNARQQAIEQVRPEELPYALSSTIKSAGGEKWRPGKRGIKNAERYDSTDNEAFDRLLTKLDTEIFNRNPDNEQTLARRVAYITTFVDTGEFLFPIRFSDPEEAQYREKEKSGDVDGLPSFTHLCAGAENMMTTPAGVEQLRQTLEQMAATPNLPYPNMRLDTLAEAFGFGAAVGGAFGDLRQGEVDISAVSTFLEQWKKTFDTLSSRWGMSDTWQADKFHNAFIDRLAKRLLSGQTEAQNQLYTLKTEKVRTEKETALEHELNHLAAQIAATHIIARRNNYAARAKQRILKDLHDRPVPEITASIRFLNNHIDEEQLFNPSIRSFDFQGSIYSPGYIGVKLLESCLKKMPHLAALSAIEKEAMRVAAVHGSGLNDIYECLSEKGSDSKRSETGYYSEVIEDPYTPVVEKEADRMEKELRGMLNLERLMSAIKTDEDVETLYRVFFDEPYPLYVDIAGRERDIGSLESVFVHAVNTYLQGESLDVIWHKLDQWENAGVGVLALLERHYHSCGPLVESLTLSIQSGAARSLPLDKLLTACSWVANPFLRASAQRAVKDTSWQELDFSARLNLILPEPGRKGISDWQSRDDFIEHDVNTRDQFQSAKDRLRVNIDNLAEQGSAAIGLGIVLDRDLRHRDTVALVKCMLTSAFGDADLKRVLYEFVVNPAAGLEEIKRGTVGQTASAVEQTSELVDNLFRSSDTTKHLLLRKLLTSEGGILRDAAKRTSFFTMLLDTMVTDDPAQRDIMSVIRAVRDELIKDKEWQLVFYALEKSLRERMAIPPPKEESYPITDLYEVEEDLQTEYGDEEDIENIKRRVFKHSRAAALSAATKMKPWLSPSQYMSTAERRLEATLYERGEIIVPEKKESTPLLFVKDIVGNMGALGVRFLQNLRLITDVPTAYAQEFDQVYDRMRGQSKAAALMLLEREWPECWQQIDSVGARIGGGSIVTVYEVKMKDGSEQVVKVRNPNIKYHLDQIYDFATKIIDNLAAKHRGAYRSARLLLDDIKAWINSDIGFDVFLPQDKNFREKHHGFTADGHVYSLYVPESRGPASAKFSIEEKVEGENLTQWDKLVQEGHDMKQVISLLVKNYIAQIQNGQVLSDVHIGNFAVTKDNKVAVYDRNFFLQLSNQEQALIAALIYSAGSAGDTGERIADYLIGDQEIVNRHQIEALTGVFVTAAKEQEWLEAQKALMNLKRTNVKVPLTFTLLLKNFQALQQMAKRAGFESGVFEAYLYTPTAKT